MKNEESVLAWLAHQVESDEIEDVTDEMLDMLIEKSSNLAAFFCIWGLLTFLILLVKTIFFLTDPDFYWPACSLWLLKFFPPFFFIQIFRW